MPSSSILVSHTCVDELASLVTKTVPSPGDNNPVIQDIHHEDAVSFAEVGGKTHTWIARCVRESVGVTQLRALTGHPVFKDFYAVLKVCWTCLCDT